jgi:hypothetical protein
LQAVVDSLATIVGQERFHGAAVAFVTALATKLNCDRVSLGFQRKGAVEIVALSHSAQFGADTNLLRAIAAAMEEALDQESTVVFPLRAERESAAHGRTPSWRASMATARFVRRRSAPPMVAAAW